MFKLVNKTGQTALMRNGEPFLYSSRVLANIAKKLLDAERKESFTITSV
jgi:hypothetical protein